MRLPDLLGVGDGVRGKGEHRLGMAGAKWAGARDVGMERDSRARR
jgi:hypothetical protein